MKRTFLFILSCTVVLSAFCIGIFSASAEKSGETDFIRTWDFSYTDNALAEADLSQNFDFVTNAGSGFGNNMEIADGRFLFSGEYAGMRYRQALSAYTLSYDYRIEDKNDTCVTRQTASPLLLRNNLNSAVTNLYESFPVDNAMLGSSGIALYLWKTNASVYVRQYQENTGTYDYTDIAEIPTGTDVRVSAVPVRVTDNGTDTIRIYFNGQLGVTLTLSEKRYVTLSDETILAYTKITRQYGTLGGTASKPSEVSNCLIPAEHASFAFAKRPLYNSKAYSIDNLQLAEPRFAEITGAQVSLSENISLYYYVTLSDALAQANPHMVFTYKGEKIPVSGTVLQSENGKTELCYSFLDLLPQDIAEPIGAALYLEGEEEPLAVRENYSIALYCDHLLEKPLSEKTQRMIYSLLNYCAASQQYFENQTESLANAALTDAQKNSVHRDMTEAVSRKRLIGEQDPSYYWSSATIGLFNTLKLRFKFYAESTENLTVTVNSGAFFASYSENDFEAVDPDGKDPSLKNQYYLYVTDLSASHFSEDITAAFYVNGERKGARVRYSVDSYIRYAVTAANPELLPICQAVYDYGVCASAYACTEESLQAVSDTGINAVLPAESASVRSDKQVGIFYFIWHGAGQSMDYSYQINGDMTKILKTLSSSGKTSFTLADWGAACGRTARSGEFYWWGEPLLGYYDFMDEWVLNRHVQMLTDAGVDFMVLDLTNGVGRGYLDRIEALFRVLEDFSLRGVRVPKVTMMCYDDSTDSVETLYRDFYAVHPEYAHLFYHWNDHDLPVIFDNISGYNKAGTAQINKASKLASYSSNVRNFFEIRDAAFPHETNPNYHAGYNSDSLLYLDFRANPGVNTDPADGYSFCCISVSELCATNRASENWFKNTGDRTRSWDGTQNRNWLPQESDAYLYGYNFSREFGYAIRQDPDMIFITGWNEWIAQLHVLSDGSVSFVDSADINNSRDIEPMKGGYGDNYYIQMCALISQFKKTDSALVSVATEPLTIDLNEGFSQWDTGKAATYYDYTGEVFSRNYKSANNWSLIYTANAADNDIYSAQVAMDDSYVYFCVTTTEPMSFWSGENRMTLFLDTDSASGWCGYDYVINRQKGSEMLLEKSTGGWNWDTVCTVSYRVEGNRMMLAVPRNLVSLRDQDVDFSFKWADSFVGTGDCWTFYTDGEAAPYGRFNYRFTVEGGIPLSQYLDGDEF